MAQPKKQTKEAVHAASSNDDPAARLGLAPVPSANRVKEVQNSIESAFSYSQQHDTLDLEKCLRSVSYLLEWCSDVGNQEVDGFAAQGLAQIVKLAAEATRDLYTHDDMLRFSGTGSEPSDLEVIQASRY